MPTHLQHAGVVDKNRPAELLEPLAFAVVDQMLHEAPTKAPAFEVRTYQDGVFGPGVVRVSDHPDHAKQSIAALSNGNEGHFACIVDLGQPGQKPVRQIGSRPKEAQPAVSRGDRGKELRIKPLILGTNRANVDVTDRRHIHRNRPF